VVTAQQLSGWAGRPVPGSEEGIVGDVTECTTVSDDGSVVITWQTQVAAASLDDEVDFVGGDGLERTEITVAGEPAVLLAGDEASMRVNKVVLIHGDQSLYVHAAWLRGVGPPASLQVLRDLAVGVANHATW
jgi:hypothetical protein